MSGVHPQPVSADFESSGERIAATVYGHSAEPSPAVLICTGFGGTQDTPSIVAAAEWPAFKAVVSEGAGLDRRHLRLPELRPQRRRAPPGRLGAAPA